MDLSTYKILFCKFCVYGILGLATENIFTGLWSLWHKDWSGTTKSYLIMIFPYGITAIALEYLSDALTWSIWFKACIYVLVIYGVEFGYGYLLKRLIGRIPWHYKSRWSIANLINMAYLPAWYVLALTFDVASPIVKSTILTWVRTGLI